MNPIWTRSSVKADAKSDQRQLFYDFIMRIPAYTVVTNVADPDPGSGAFLTPGTGSRRGLYRILDPKPIFLELSDKVLGKDFYNSLKLGQIFFFSISKIK
jgi:hypothetical protein